MADIRWVWVFLDTVETQAGPSWEFWRQVTRSTLSPTRGDRSEFATFLPERGDPWIKVQAVRSGGGVHLDLEVDDPIRAAGEAAALGATRVGTLGDPASVAIMSTPGGQVFCLTGCSRPATGPVGSTGPRRQVREGHADLVDQVCLDLPDLSYAVDAVFWHGFTGWELGHGAHREFGFLRRPDGLPVRLLLQRLGDREGPAGAHVDLACVDRHVTRSRHEGLGATFVTEGDGWTVMADPVGRHYCLTDRDPATGARPAATAGAEPRW